MDTMPDRYETQQTTTTGPPAGSSRVTVNVAYLRTLPGILKIVEMVLDLIVVICVASVTFWSSHPSGSFITFVGVFGLVTTVIFFILHLTTVIYKIPGPWVLIEFGYLAGMAIFYFIAGIVGAAYSGVGDGAIAAAIFCFISLVVHSVEIFLCFRVWRTGGGFYVSTAGTSTTTATAANTTTTTVKTHEEYAS